MTSLLDLVRQRVVVFDGAMGTQIHAADLDLDEYWGQEGNSEVLNLSRPDVIGADPRQRTSRPARTASRRTRSARNVIVQARVRRGRQGPRDQRGRRADRQGGRLPRITDKPRFVVGTSVPGTKLPTLGNATFKELEHSYTVQVDGLMEGGVDALIIETCQDLLQTKTAIAACQTAFAKFGRKVPLIVQVTIETTGTMLVGSDISAALAALEPYREIDVVGLNCATGPVEMIEHVRYLTPALATSGDACCRTPDSPRSATARRTTRCTPDELVAHLNTFVDEFGVSDRRRLLRDDAGVHQAASQRRWRAACRRSARPSSSRQRLRSTPRSRSVRTHRCSSSASGATPTARASSRS